MILNKAIKASAALVAALLSTYSFSAEVIYDRALSFGVVSSTEDSRYGFPGLSDGGVRTPNGQIAVNTDFEAVAATPDQASEFTEAGFYFLTYCETENGSFGLDLPLESYSFFQTTRREIRASIFVDGVEGICDGTVRGAMAWNFEFEGLGDEIILSEFVDVDTRTLEVITAQPMAKVFASVNFSGDIYNFEMSSLDGINWSSVLPPEIGTASQPTFLANKYFSIDANDFLYESIELSYFSGNSFVMNILKAYFLTSRLFDREFFFQARVEGETDTVYIHYTINGEEFNVGTSAYNYIMEAGDNRSFTHTIPAFVELESGDVVEFYATYNIGGVFYDTVRQTATVF